MSGFCRLSATQRARRPCSPKLRCGPDAFIRCIFKHMVGGEVHYPWARCLTGVELGTWRCVHQHLLPFPPSVVSLASSWHGITVVFELRKRGIVLVVLVLGTGTDTGTSNDVGCPCQPCLPSLQIDCISPSFPLATASNQQWYNGRQSNQSSLRRLERVATPFSSVPLPPSPPVLRRWRDPRTTLQATAAGAPPDNIIPQHGNPLLFAPAQTGPTTASSFPSLSSAVCCSRRSSSSNLDLSSSRALPRNLSSRSPGPRNQLPPSLSGRQDNNTTSPQDRA
jgi:hypothetical protein